MSGVDIGAWAARIAKADVEACERARAPVGDWNSAHVAALAYELGIPVPQLLDEDVHAAKVAYEVAILMIYDLAEEKEAKRVRAPAKLQVPRSRTCRGTSRTASTRRWTGT